MNRYNQSDLESQFPKKKPFLWLSLGVGLLVCFFTTLAWWQAGKPMLGIDDANIFFVYAKNLTQGHGLTYNGMLVEGYSSFLYVWVCALFFWLFTQAETAIFFFNTILQTVALLFLFYSIRKKNNKETYIIITGMVMGWLILTPDYWIWNNVSLLDTNLSTVFLLSLFCSLYLNYTKLYAVLVTIAYAIRPEMAFVAFFTLPYYGFTAGGVKAILRPALGMAASVVLLTAVRLWLFGLPLPLTFYAKVDSSTFYTIKQGVNFLAVSFNQNPLLALFSAFNFIILLHSINKKTITATQVALPLINLAYILTMVLKGGDHFAQQRLWQPILPLLIFPMAIRLNNYFNIKNLKTAVAIIGLLLFTAYFSYPRTWFQTTATERKNFLDGDFRIAEGTRIFANKLNKIFINSQPQPSVGVSVAGGFAMAYRGTVVDLLGLNNKTMALSTKRRIGPKNHAAFSIDGFKKTYPDVFLPEMYAFNRPNPTLPEPYKSQNFAHTWQNNLFKNIFNNHWFLANYVPAFIYEPHGNEYIFAYVKKSMLQKQQTYTIKTIEPNPNAK